MAFQPTLFGKLIDQLGQRAYCRLTYTVSCVSTAIRSMWTVWCLLTEGLSPGGASVCEGRLTADAKYSEPLWFGEMNHTKVKHDYTKKNNWLGNHAGNGWKTHTLRIKSITNPKTRKRANTPDRRWTESGPIFVTLSDASWNVARIED